MAQDHASPLSASSPADSNSEERQAANFLAAEQNKPDGVVLDSGYNEYDSTQVEPINIKEEPDNDEVGVAIAIDEQTRREEQIRKFDTFVKEEILSSDFDVVSGGVISKLTDGVVPNENNLPVEDLPDNSSFYELQPFGSIVNFGHNINGGEQFEMYRYSTDNDNSLPNSSFYYPNDYYSYSSEGSWPTQQYDPAYNFTEKYMPSNNADQTVSYQIEQQPLIKSEHVDGGSCQTLFDQQSQNYSPHYTNYKHVSNESSELNSNRSFVSDHQYCTMSVEANVDEKNLLVEDLQNIEAMRQINARYTHQRFPIKLWNLASDDEFLPINWSQDGSSIMFNELTLEPILGEFFRSKKFSSFLRQLHLYGFRKVTRSRSRHNQNDREVLDRTDYFSEYQAGHFQRDRFDLVKMVRRFYGSQNQTNQTKSKQMDAQVFEAVPSPSSSTIFYTDHDQAFNSTAFNQQYFVESVPFYNDLSNGHTDHDLQPMHFEQYQ